MITSKRNMRRLPIEIDLTGPDGNAFVLLGMAQRLGKQLSWSKKEIEALLKDMQSSDYEHLLKVFDVAFGEIVTLYR